MRVGGVEQHGLVGPGDERAHRGRYGRNKLDGRAGVSQEEHAVVDKGVADRVAKCGVKKGVGRGGVDDLEEDVERVGDVPVEDVATQADELPHGDVGDKVAMLPVAAVDERVNVDDGAVIPRQVSLLEIVLNG